MKQGIFTVRENRALNARYNLLALEGDSTGFTAPGQFADILVPGFYLRRPFAVCDWEDDFFTLVYECVGNGTRRLKTLGAGTELDVLTGLGNGYTLEGAGESPLLVGGGCGVGSLYGLAKQMLRQGLSPRVILGFPRREEITLLEDYIALGLRPTVTTADGSFGVRGLVTDAMDIPHSSVYACGPEPMLRAVALMSPAGGQLSFDARMGCGFGACMGCTRQTVNGPRRVCKDGPVFRKEEILWED
ncbi:MAG: dihydroorotate dehydrogenase electron transfer subunit [Oscillospiraceae bacterium]|nr:dihydroorotate dehydrogenase electron transfer subunit [Oscillospiraceae bacterium]